jgi:hypothetical protein
MSKMKRIKLICDSGFLRCLMELKLKEQNLRDRLFKSQADEVKTLCIALEGYRTDFINGDMKLGQFTDNCKEVIKAAQSAELPFHRSIWGKILNDMLKALNVITFGVVSGAPRPTDSMFKMQKISDLVDFLSPRPRT